MIPDSLHLQVMPRETRRISIFPGGEVSIGGNEFPAAVFVFLFLRRQLIEEDVNRRQTLLAVKDLEFLIVLIGRSGTDNRAERVRLRMRRSPRVNQVLHELRHLLFPPAVAALKSRDHKRKFLLFNLLSEGPDAFQKGFKRLPCLRFDVVFHACFISDH